MPELLLPPTAPPAEIERLRSRLCLSPVLATLLWQRGHRNPDEARRWLKAVPEDLEDPFQFRQMDRAVRRIRHALRKRERILIHGDYDVDGLSATVLLLGFFRMLGAEVEYHIPARADGYSFSQASVDRIKAGGYKLCISVDNGTAAIEEIQEIQSLCCDVIVTDHHATGPRIAPAFAVLNPRLEDSGYPFPDLAGVGVAFKLAWAIGSSFSRRRMLSGELEEFLIDAASLVALGTVADVVPLRGENRVLVRRGLDALRASRSPGILALLDILGPGSSSLTADDIAFRLGPRLNAAGRMAHASLAVELLTAPSYGVAQEKARELELWNKRRQSVEQSVFAELLEAIGDVSSAPVILACREGWHLGILGILAARLAERFRRPSLVLRIEEGLARGSGRSIRGIDLRSLLDRIELAGLRYGGHAAAVGLELPADRLPSFRERLELAARDMPAPRSEPWRIDASVGLGHWCSSELRRLADFGPFGAGNPPPSFLARNVRIGAALRRVGRDGTGLAFNAIQDGVSVQALAPQLGARMETLLRQREPWDLVYAPRFASRAELGPLEILVHEMRAGTTDGRSDERAHGS